VSSSEPVPTGPSPLSDAHLAAFDRDGFVAGIPALDPAEAEGFRRRLVAIEANEERRAAEAACRRGWRGTLDRWRHLGRRWWTARDWKPDDGGTHPLRDVILELASHPALTAIAAARLGPDLLARNADVFVREPWEKDGVWWHRDTRETRPGVERTVSVWVALTDVTRRGGPLWYLPGSHRQRLACESDCRSLTLPRDGLDRATRARAVPNVMPAGHVSMHDHRIVHMSTANRTRTRRVAVAIRYLADDVDPRAAEAAGGCLVRGEHRSERTSLVDAVAVHWA